MRISDQFFTHLSHNPDEHFYIDIINDRQYTRGEFSDEALKLCSFFQDQGIREGDTLAMVFPNCVESALFYFACLYSRMTLVPLNPILHPSEVEYILKSTNPKAVFLSPSTADRINPEIEKTFRQRLCGFRILQESEQEWNTSFRNVSSRDIFSDFSPASLEMNRIPDDQLLTITFTSGTTQKPKGVVHRFENFVNNALRFIAVQGIGKENSFYGVLSQAYMGGFYNLLLLPWIAGSSIAFGKAFDALTAISFWDAPMKYRLNTLWLVPTIMAILLKVDRNEKGREYARNNIRLALVGTAPLPVPLRKDFEKRYGIRLYENYGLSEILFVSTNFPGDSVIDGSVGKVLKDVDVSILSPAGGLLSSGEEGEICVRTPDRMKGYFQEKENVTEQKSSSKDMEWFATGDVGYLDSQGRLFITGRKKDLIIRGGINISPSAIENIIMEHPAVSQAAVVGIPHEIYGEDIAAVVKMKPGFSLKSLQKELEDLCRDKLGQIRKPAMFFEIEEFPASTTGKIQKNKLREMLKVKLGK